jgi:hypothetical protein
MLSIAFLNAAATILLTKVQLHHQVELIIIYYHMHCVCSYHGRYYVHGHAGLYFEHG